MIILPVTRDAQTGRGRTFTPFTPDGGFTLDDGVYAHRKSVTISRASGAVTNYPMKTVISESNNFAPVGVTGSTSTIPLPWVISASSETAPSYAWCAFDSTTNYWRTAYTTLTGSLTVDLGAGYEQKLTSYAVTGFETGAETTLRNPKDWTVQGSNNNSDWTTVDTVTGETGWGNFEKRTYVCDSPSATAFRYYKIDITANNGSTQYTGLCELLLLNTAYGCGNKCKTDFSDLRFTTSDGTTLLDYWIESVQGATPNQIATVWIEADSIGTSDTTFYMYYGNADADAYSNGSSTFLEYDDFTGSNGDPWSSSKWDSANRGATLHASAIADIQSNAGRIYQASQTNTQWSGIERMGKNTLSLASDGLSVVFSTTVQSSASYLHGVGLFKSVNNLWDGPMVRFSSAAGTTVIADQTGDKAHAHRSGTHKYELQVKQWQARLLEDGVEIIGFTSFSNLVTDSVKLSCMAWSSSSTLDARTFDYVYVKKYLATEPVWGAWGAEEAA